MPALFPYWDDPEFVQCPHCHVAYECKRIGVHFHDKTQFTIVCTNCKKAFDVDTEPRSFGKPYVKVSAR